MTIVLTLKRGVALGLDWGARTLVVLVLDWGAGTLVTDVGGSATDIDVGIEYGSVEISCK